MFWGSILHNHTGTLQQKHGTKRLLKMIFFVPLPRLCQNINQNTNWAKNAFLVLENSKAKSGSMDIFFKKWGSRIRPTRGLTYVQSWESPVFKLAEEVSRTNALSQVQFSFPAFLKRINKIMDDALSKGRRVFQLFLTLQHTRSKKRGW